MSDIEKGATEQVSMPLPPAYKGEGRQSFNPVYSHFVNDNMRNMRDEQAGPIQAFDKIEMPKRGSKWLSKRRQLIYFAIGCLIILAVALVGILVLGRPHGDKDKDSTKALTAQAMTVTETPSPSFNVSVSVSTTISKTTKVKTTTVATTAPIPKSIAHAASSFYEAARASVKSDFEEGQSMQSAALTKYPGSTAAPTTLIVTTTPPPETVVQTMTAATTPDLVTTTTEVPESVAPEETTPTPTTLRNWINFCGVPGQACG